MVVSGHLCPQQAGAARQVEHRDVPVELQLEEGLDTLGVAGVVAHHHQVLVVLVAPVVVELDPVLGVRVVHQDVRDLLLQGGGHLHVHIVGQRAHQPLEQVEDPLGLGLTVNEYFSLQNLIFNQLVVNLMDSS